MNLATIRARCLIDEDTGCWHWTGALSDGRWPRIHAPNLSKPGNPMEVQTGRRVVWQLLTGKPIPPGHRVHGRCDDPQCLNPDHMRCGPTREWGAHLRRTGHYKNSPARVIANRASGRGRSKLTPAIIEQILLSDETGVALEKRLGVSNSLVSKVRQGKAIAWQGQANPFAGLMDRRAA
jgi:hypothetical protein